MQNARKQLIEDLAFMFVYHQAYCAHNAPLPLVIGLPPSPFVSSGSAKE